MMERSVPWWRRALTVALDGIRSGFGLFRRHGKAAAGTELAVEAGPVAQHSEPERDETEAQKEESRVKPSSPQSETTAAQEPTAAIEPAQAKDLVAAKNEASAEVDAPQFEPPADVAAAVAQEPAPEPPAPAPESPAPGSVAPEPLAPTLAEPEIPVAAILAPVVQAAEELSGEQQDLSGHGLMDGGNTLQGSQDVSGHDFSRADSTATDEGAFAPAASLPSTDAEVPSPSKSTGEPAPLTPAVAGETTQAAQTASAEDMMELLEIAAPPAPEEAVAPDPEPPPVIEPPTVPEPLELEPPEPPPLPVPDPPLAPPVTEPPGPEPAGPDPLPAPVPIDIAPTLPFPEKPQRTTAEKVAAALKARGEDAEQSPFSVIVNQIYDGPLDLLLDLIRKQDIDIYDIPIAKITAQFLAYVDQLRAGDMDVAGEFIYTAALLIHIKSRMLLPRSPAGPDDAAEDPRRELVERLLEHERFKNAAQMLHEKQMLEAASWTNPGIREFQEDLGAEPEIAADTTDLVRVFSGILERARNRPILNLEEDSVTVGQMIQFLARRLTMEDKPVALRRLLSHTKSERALIAMFLALLELVRLQAILLRQDRHFSEIFIKKHTGFEALMNQGLANARDDWR